MTTPCLLTAWEQHETELRNYLRHRTGNPHDAEDLLQDVFLKALRQGSRFCSVENVRAWLFQVTRNALTDKLRQTSPDLPLADPDDLAAPPPGQPAPVESLAQCLPRVLAELSAQDRLAITLCDIEGKSQQELADQLGLSLPGAKSRIQRARLRLQQRLVEACRVRFDDQGNICCFTPRSPLE